MKNRKLEVKDFLLSTDDENYMVETSRDRNKAGIINTFETSAKSKEVFVSYWDNYVKKIGIPMTIGVILKEIRVSKNIKLKEVNEISSDKVKASTLSVIENNGRNVTLTYLEKILDAYNMDYDKFIEYFRLCLTEYCKKNDNQDISAFLKGKRIESGYKLEELSKILDVASINITKFENQLYALPPGKLEKYFNIIGIGIGYLENLMYKSEFFTLNYWDWYYSSINTSSKSIRLGEVFREIRKSRNLTATQIQSVTQIKIRENYISYIENGIRRISNNKFKELLAFYGINFEQFISVAKKCQNDKCKSPNNLSHYLRSARIDKEMSTEELADKMKVSTATIEKWENGFNSINIKRLREICKCLELNFTEVYNLTIENTISNSKINHNSIDKGRDNVDIQKIFNEMAKYRYVSDNKCQYSVLAFIIALLTTLERDSSHEKAQHNLKNNVVISDTNKFGIILREQRIKLGLRLSDIKVVSPSYCRHIETGFHFPQLKTLWLIMDELKLADEDVYPAYFSVLTQEGSGIMKKEQLEELIKSKNHWKCRNEESILFIEILKVVDLLFDI